MFADADYGFAIIASIVGTAGLLLMVAADRVSKHIKSKAGRAILAWPLGLVGFALMGTVALLIVANLFSPILLAIWLLIKPN